MNAEIFLRGAKDLGIEIDEDKLDKFQIFSRLLCEWNQKINLTTITDPDDISVKHFLDSLAVLSVYNIAYGARLIDIGTGAGFPGVPLKIVRPDLEIVLMDSLLKRVRFLEELVVKLDLKSTSCLHGRAETICKLDQYKEQFDISVARAVAPFEKLCGYCLPYLKPGAVLIALKSNHIQEELSSLESTLKKSRGEMASVFNITLPETDIVRKIVVIKKVR